jgi:hypothetical protein
VEIIAEFMLKKLQKRLREKSVSLVINDVIIQALLAHGVDPDMGARPMARAVQELVEQKVAEKIISGKLLPGASLEFTLDDFPELKGVSDHELATTPVDKRMPNAVAFNSIHIPEVTSVSNLPGNEQNPASLASVQPDQFMPIPPQGALSLPESPTSIPPPPITPATSIPPPQT